MSAVNSPVRDTKRIWQELCTRPIWKADDVGKAIPNTPHATSVAMPLWEHVVRYEERDPAVLEVMECGYPRFVFNKRVQALIDTCQDRFARGGEKCLVFPSERAAAQCAEFLRRQAGCSARLMPVSPLGVTAVLVPEAGFDQGRKCWQHYGRIVSSRLADAVLGGQESADDDGAKESLRQSIAKWSQTRPDHVFLYPTGMAALADGLRTVQSRTPGARTVQIGFPYVDLLKIQSFADAGVAFHSSLDENAHEEVLRQVRAESIAGVFCEAPGNPLLRTPDLERLSTVLREKGVPLVVDETLASFVNADLRPYADLIVTSLTKYISGVGDVMGGSVIVNPESPMAESLRAALSSGYEDTLFAEDAVVLAENAADFPERMRHINVNAETVCEFLMNHDRVDHLYYPKYETTPHYNAIRRPDGGYGGLFSLTLKGGAAEAEAFYNALRVNKGPSLGMNFTMACPFVILAHYDELDWAASHGVPSHLIRISIGLEDAQDLIGRFCEALRRQR